MATIGYPKSQVMKDICTSSGGHGPIRHVECKDVPPNDLLQFANVTSIHDACAAVVKLL